jgi:hypothetical protein
MGDVVRFQPLRARRRGPPPPAGPATTPNSPAAVYRAVDGRPLHWKDTFGTIHACEQTESGDVKVAWTICGRDLTDSAVYVAESIDHVSCVKCQKDRWEAHGQR